MRPDGCAEQLGRASRGLERLIWSSARMSPYPEEEKAQEHSQPFDERRNKSASAQ